MNFYIEKRPWGGGDSLYRKPSGGKVFYIDNLPGGLISMGDDFLYDTGINCRWRQFILTFAAWIVADDKHLLRYWPIFARSSTLHFAGAVNTWQKITMHTNNLISSEFPNRSSRSARSFISTLNCTLDTRGHFYKKKIKDFSSEFEYFTPKWLILD